MLIYSVSTSWEKTKTKINYHFHVSGDTTLRQLYQYIIQKNHEWFNHKFIDHKFKQVWFENILTNEKVDDRIRIGNLASTTVFKKISGEVIKEIHPLQFKAILEIS